MASVPIVPQPTGNPILDNPTLKAALAAKMAQPQPSGTPPTMPAPGSMHAAPSIGGASPLASVPNPGTQAVVPSGDAPPAPMLTLPSGSGPQIKAPRGTVEGDENERGRLLQNGSGISRIAHNIEGTQFGQDHPLLGKVAGVGLQGLATLGDTALSLTGPGRIAESMIPGTAGYHAAQLRNVGGELAQDETNQEKQAQTANLQAEVPLKNAQGQEASARADALEHPPAKQPEYDIKETVDPQGNSIYAAVNKSDPNDVHPIPSMKVPPKEVVPKNMEAKTLQLPNGQQVAGKVDSQGNLLTADGKPAPSGTKLYQQPNYGQMMLPTKTATFIGDDGVPREYQWNEATGTYDKPLGISASNAYGHEVAQAGAVNRGGQEIISELRDPSNRQILGNLDSYIKQGTLGTPLADAQAAKLSAELRTFAALQPAMHGFRSRSAQEAFEKIVGGLAQNPDATIGSIEGILKTAGNINPNLPRGDAAGGSGTITVDAGGKTYTFKDQASADKFKAAAGIK